MQRSAASLIIFFFSISVFSADSRVERWNLHTEKLKKIILESSSGKVDKPAVDEIIGGEIKSGEEFLDILNRYKKEDGSLKSETKKYTVGEIEKKVKESSLPAISLYYISDLFKAAGDTQTKEKTAAEIIKYSEKKFGKSLKISRADYNLIAEHYIFEKGIAEFDAALKNATGDILSKTEYELSRSDYNSNDEDLKQAIRKITEETLAAKKFCDTDSFNEKLLVSVPQLKFITDQYSNIEARNRSLWNFVYGGKTPLESTANIKDTNSAEEEIFSKAREKISDMLQNTTPSSGAMGNNPYYEIPDLKKLGVTLDEIDQYRKTLIQNINGSEDKDLVSKLKSNNTGIAARGIHRIEAQFKSEEARIERLKKIKGEIIIYNEEVFKASLTHFSAVKEELNRYADLSAEFTGALYSAGKIDPQKFIDFHKYRSERYLYYISFSEKLSSNIVPLSGSGSAKFHSLYKGTIPKVLASAKNLLKPETIPAEIRETLKRENLKEYGSINADFRIKGSQLTASIRKNYDDSIAGYSQATADKKESSIVSESRIGQDETDRLFSFAQKCSEKIKAMNYTNSALKKYKEEYTRINDDLKKGNKISMAALNDASLTFFAAVPGFNPSEIERETATRELLSKEGAEALSGSITLVQYYKRKGYPVKFTPANDEIISMKKTFSDSPEVIVSSWKMNGKNFRQIDVNVTAELKKMLNKNAWNNNINIKASEIFNIDDSGIKVAFTPPAGWKKIHDSGDGRSGSIIFESPDMKGSIEVTSICEEEQNLQALAGKWPEKSGFSMTEKNWGKKNNTDYLKSTAKNRYDGVMESYMVAKKGRIIILTGKTTGEMYRQLNRTLADIFRNLEITELSI